MDKGPSLPFQSHLHALAMLSMPRAHLVTLPARVTALCPQGGQTRGGQGDTPGTRHAWPWAPSTRARPCSQCTTTHWAPLQGGNQDCHRAQHLWASSASSSSPPRAPHAVLAPLSGPGAAAALARRSWEQAGAGAWKWNSSTFGRALLADDGGGTQPARAGGYFCGIHEQGKGDSQTHDYVKTKSWL